MRMIRHAVRHLAAIVLFTAAASAQPHPRDIIQVRVVPGWTEAGSATYAALHIRLAPGWKTYWRLPGAAGIAPEFDWSGSDNVAGVRIHWPHPEVFTDYGIRTIGYAGEVYLPLSVQPEQPGAPVTLEADAALGVCREVCLPVRLGIVTKLPAGADAPPADAAGVRAAVASAGGASVVGRAVCRMTPIDDGLQIEVEISGTPDLGGGELVFIRPERSDVWVSEPEMQRVRGGVRATADLVPPEAKPFAIDRSELRFTLLGATGSAEVKGCDAG